MSHRPHAVSTCPWPCRPTPWPCRPAPRPCRLAPGRVDLPQAVSTCVKPFRLPLYCFYCLKKCRLFPAASTASSTPDLPTRVVHLHSKRTPRASHSAHLPPSPVHMLPSHVHLPPAPSTCPLASHVHLPPSHVHLPASSGVV